MRRFYTRMDESPPARSSRGGGRLRQDLKAQLGVAPIARPDGGGIALGVQF
jgi:hypothetical protein